MKGKSFSDHIIPMELTTYWTIMPKDTNYMFPLVFGGAMMSQVDLAAATHTRMLLHWTGCDKAVTHKANILFSAPSYAGDTIRFDSKLVEVRDNSLRFIVEVYRIPLTDNTVPKQITYEHIGTHELVFVTMSGESFTPHRLRDVIPAEVLKTMDNA
jgi:acyl-CoA hydrolase